MSHLFFLGRCILELAQDSSSTALAWHAARCGAPFGVTFVTSDPFICGALRCMGFQRVCVYIHTHTYANTYTYSYTHTCSYTYTYTYTHACTYTYTYTYKFRCPKKSCAFRAAWARWTTAGQNDLKRRTTGAVSCQRMPS